MKVQHNIHVKLHDKAGVVLSAAYFVRLAPDFMMALHNQLWERFGGRDDAGSYDDEDTRIIYNRE